MALRLLLAGAASASGEAGVELLAYEFMEQASGRAVGLLERLERLERLGRVLLGGRSGRDAVRGEHPPCGPPPWRCPLYYWSARHGMLTSPPYCRVY